jgi:hypothetical protein
VDGNGNLYYSDEINHSVVSLNPSGVLRWHKTLHGVAPGQFYYPRGICLGWIKKGEDTSRCLAICDAWNRRVQLLDLDGNIVDVWTHFAETPFAEVTDIRFIRGEFNSERAATPMGFWFVLDKGNHRLCALNQKGEPMFQIGRCCSPTVETYWAVPGLFLERDFAHPGFVKDFPACDFAYYPERILGDSENALYLWEPLSQRIKQALLGCLLPIHVVSKGVEWISADLFRIVGWQRDAHRLTRYDCHGQCQQGVEIHGTPILSNLPLDQFWVQECDRIERWQWDFANPEPEELRPFKIYSPLLRSAQAELSMLDMAQVREAVAGWCVVPDIGLYRADELLAVGRGDIDPERLDLIREGLRPLPEWRSNAEQALHAALHHWCLGLLEYHLLGSAADEPAKQIAGARDQWDVLAAPIRQKFVEIQDRLNDLLMLRLRLQREPNRDDSLVKRWTEVSLAAEADLQQALEGVYRWSGIVEGSEKLWPIPWLLPETPFGTDRVPGRVVCRQSHQSYKHLFSCLREVDQIPLGPGNESRNPHSLARSPEGDLFVSLALAHQILRLDAEGNIIERFGNPGKGAGEFQGPRGLALDSNGRLWVADCDNHRIQVFDLKRNTVEIVGSYGSGLGQFIAPLGIGARPDGSMLVTDSGNHRIIRITSEGKCEIFNDRSGRGRGELRQPTAFYPGGQGSLWLVDQGNHRLQKLDAAADWVQEIGACGLGSGSLFLPESAAEFGDGVVAVAQNRWNRVVKLFSPSGAEVGKMVLNYIAGGMIVDRQRLLVVAMDLDSIRVYERMQF